jgi:hypothetical protein
MVTDHVASRRGRMFARAAAVAIPLVGVAMAACSSKNAADPNEEIVIQVDADLADGARLLDPDAPPDRCPTPQRVSASSCGSPGDAQAPDAAVPVDASDAKGGDAGARSASDSEPLLDLSGADDQCKYFLTLTPATPLVPGQPVTFTLDGALLATQTPMTGAAPRVEASLYDAHPLAVPAGASAEPTPGHYTIGPLTFDAAGVWTLRLHLYERCTEDAPDSPAGNVAFALVVGNP